MTIEPLILMIAFLVGTVLGLFYFGLLWVTVRRIPHSRNPALLVLGSLVGRLAVVLTAFYFVMNGRWERLAACLLGFLVARQVMVSRIRPRTTVGRPSEADRDLDGLGRPSYRQIPD
jgi:F1F0 ATPase subunit 2